MSNIHFKIGQPNTGKSFGFEEKQLRAKPKFLNKKIKYLKIAVSGGIGNEYKGLQNTDLAISFDPIKQEVRFGEFLQMLMSAIIQPTIPHIVFLDDFHNQDISSLLSEYTPLFKSQQMRDLTSTTENITTISEHIDLLKIDEYESSDSFINKWNSFIDCLKDTPVSPITNRISGSQIKLVFPANFFLYGAANFNEKTLNIFSDWADRARIEVIDPIFEQGEHFIPSVSPESNGFITCIKLLNENLRKILSDEHQIFDYERYCFGIWKAVNSNGEVFSDTKEQVTVTKFFFSMIKNSMIYNNKNSLINEVGVELVNLMQADQWFKDNVFNAKDEALDLENERNKALKVLHDLCMYES